MDGLVEELLRLESAKHKALVEIDASAYDSSVRQQLRLLSSSRNSAAGRAASIERLLMLSQLITLNARLLQNLISTSPAFAFSKNGYTARGGVAMPAVAGRVAVEA